MIHENPLDRRKFIGHTGAVVAAGCLSDALVNPGGAADEEKKPRFPQGTAEACIFLWLGGGACQIDTWDPKQLGDGKKKAGSYYDAIPTAIRGASVCEHLARTAPLLDRAALVRSVHHEVIDEHAAAVNRMHTGRPVSGTIVYPSIGSIIAHERGAEVAGVPPYVVMGYPNVTRGPGFLGAKYGYLYLTETDAGPNGLNRAPDVPADRQERRERLLGKLRDDFVRRNPGEESLADYAAVSRAGFELARSPFAKVFDLKGEPADLREAYGGEFGQRCLLARRLVQAGTRFVEVSFNLNFVNGTGWDTHNDGQLKQHLLIDQLDQALATLILDLDKHRLLDKTLIVVSTEFGRPPEFDAGGGRGHHSKSFSVVLAGGGLRTGQAIGVTDDLGKSIVEHPVSVPDLFATMLCALGVNPSKELRAGDRPVPLTDRGEPIRELFG